MTFRTHRSLPRSMDSAIRFGKIININLKEQRQRGGKEREAERKEVNDGALWLCFRGWMAMRVWRNGGEKGEKGVDNLRERAGQPTVRYGDGAEQKEEVLGEHKRKWSKTKERLSALILALQALLHAQQRAALFLNGARVALCLLRHHPQELYHYSITTALTDSLSPWQPLR